MTRNCIWNDVFSQIVTMLLLGIAIALVGAITSL